MLAHAQIHKQAVVNQAESTSDAVIDLYQSIVGGFLSSANMYAFIDAAIPIIKAGMGNAHTISGGAYRRARTGEGVRDTFTFPGRRSVADEQIASSLKYLGFVAPRRRQNDGEVAFEIPMEDLDPGLTESTLEGGVGRRVVQESMDAIARAARADDRAIGWARVTMNDGNVCYFCSMLESRGVVYSKASFESSDPRFRGNSYPPAVLDGELAAKAHDHCRCVLTPVFSQGSDVIENADRLYSTWLEVQKQYAAVARMLGWDMIKVWRLWWEDRIDDEISRRMG